jgi:hypothetical protein
MMTKLEIIEFIKKIQAMFEEQKVMFAKYPIPSKQREATKKELGELITNCQDVINFMEIINCQDVINYMEIIQ